VTLAYHEATPTFHVLFDSAAEYANVKVYGVQANDQNFDSLEA